jgi:DNA-binding NarL/FixJ family response regulator
MVNGVFAPKSTCLRATRVQPIIKMDDAESSTWIVLNLIVQGMSNKEIARSLKLAEGTVKIHIVALFAKLGVHRRAAVAAAGSRFFSWLEQAKS